MPHAVRFAEPILKAALKAPKGSVSALLTYPIRDIDGDYLNPAGGEWDELEAVNWEHGCPIAHGIVCMKSIPVKGDDGEVTRVPVPIGTSRFFSSTSDLRGVDLAKYEILPNGTKGKAIGEWKPATCLKAAEEAYELIEANAAPGVSVEFVPLRASKTGQVSQLTNRSCLNVDLWRLQTWAHCAYPRNPGAMVLPDDTRIVKALSVAQSGRLPSGRPITSEIILKAFQGLKSMPRRAIVNGARLVKASDMDPESGDELTESPDAYTGADDAGQDAPMDDLMGGGPPPTTAQRLYDAAQAVADICAHLEEMEGDSPNPDYVLNPKVAKLQAKAKAMCEELRAFVDDLSALADKADAVSGGASGSEAGESEAVEDAAGGEETAAEDTAAEDSEDAGEEDSELDEDADDKFTKALPVTRTAYSDDGRIITKSGYRPKRLHYLKVSDLQPVEDSSPSPDPAQLKALQSDLERLQVQIRRRERLMAHNSY